MRKFHQYVAMREDSSMPDGRRTDKSVLPVLEKLTKILWERYHQEYKQFCMELGNNDPEVRELFDRADSVKEPFDRPTNHIPDEMNPSISHVVPPRSDMPGDQE